MPSKYICSSVVTEFLNIDARFEINRPKLQLEMNLEPIG